MVVHDRSDEAATKFDTTHATYLVDCGLNQGSGEQFPDLRGLWPGDINAVFLTHAHIDHCGGLPVLGARGLLDNDARSSRHSQRSISRSSYLKIRLKIHQLETTSRDQEFTERDVQAIFERFQPVNYGGGLVAGVADVPKHESLVFWFENAAHLLGSAWLSLQNYTQTQLAEHFARNVESVEQVTRSRLLTPIPVTRDTEVATPVFSPERVEGSSTDVREQVEHLRELVATLSEEVAAVRNNLGLSEADVRKIVRYELE